MTTKEVAERYGMSFSVTSRWASENGVQRGEPIHGIMPFNWTEDDCKRFEERCKIPGRRKTKPRT